MTLLRYTPGGCTLPQNVRIRCIYLYILTNLRSDVKLSKMFQTQANQTVFFLFPNKKIPLVPYQKIPSQNQLVLSAANSFKLMT